MPYFEAISGVFHALFWPIITGLLLAYYVIAITRHYAQGGQHEKSYICTWFKVV